MEKRVFEITLVVWLLVAAVKPATAYQEVNISSERIGKPILTVKRADLYEYAPSIMEEGGGYKMWFCSNKIKNDWNDVIGYSTSADLINWTPMTEVLHSAQPPQGIWACDPSVVKASNGLYYMYYTSEVNLKPNNTNQIYLATSSDGVNWNYGNNKNPIISSIPDQTYGKGQSSVIFKDNKFIHFYSDYHGDGRGRTYVAESVDGGINFNPLNGGKWILEDMASADVKWMPKIRKYIAAGADFDGWSFVMFVFDENFKIEKKLIFPKELMPNECNHNVGILGDEFGFVPDENKVKIFIPSGPKGVDKTCFNPNSWDVYWVSVDLGGLVTKIAGDANGDGKVNMADFLIWRREFLTQVGTRSDFTGDGKVTFADFGIWRREFLKSIDK